MEAAVPCEPCHWGLRRSPPYEATKRVRECRHGCGGAMLTLPLGPSAELPMGLRFV